ncbi:hypothetical protein CB3_030 [Pectobacterium phage vB_PatP_CB3]|uniref:Uncharacterized protein n=2 Tax=Cbunavirus CB4 TaxID=2845777 RepID=A0A2P0N9S7_9CAUD|nr:hypothetical protein HWB09_gp030 [Pectobacterium phage vB_PatP_CB4]AQT27872.1 hypothetical protein CB4_030 [Pectobacterium phage vB_PatP_CB4]ARB11854.1 hypothetical protein CB3_030 [Pectobacterium phage vB_PatP_CB3]
MFTLAHFTADYLNNCLPNRQLLKTVSPEAKRNVLHRMAKVLITGDRFLNNEYVEVNGCYKLRRNSNVPK